jgi:superfamily II DNA or RNA helicase/HKD family nuclease/predicted house-cleaning noncanonical NTP pyrophosphatase (MazG superfamily)
MSQLKFDKLAFYRKLVRDRVPEILRESGQNPFIRNIKGEEFRKAIGQKIIDDAYELFSEWTRGDAVGILRQSTEILEIILEVLKEHGFDLHDLLASQEALATAEGSFSRRVLLESTGLSPLPKTATYEKPSIYFNPADSSQLIDLIGEELSKSDSAWIASAFYSPGIINLLLSAFYKFISEGGVLRILLSTMGNMTNPQYLSHLKKNVEGAEVKVFHPPDLPFEQSPPNFHVKVYLFRYRNGSGAMLIGSSNFTEAGFLKNVEWNYFSPGEINVPFDKDSPFQKALNQFKHYWNNESVEISDEFLSGYNERYRGSWVWEDSEKPELFDPGRSAWAKNKILPNEAQIEALETLTKMRSEGIKKAAVIAATGIGKTYIAAFDFKQVGGRLLFIAHRENILAKALESFRDVIGDKGFGYILRSGKSNSGEDNSAFAMIQTLSRNSTLDSFDPEYFDYIVMDEFHHSEADTYRRVIKHFRPKFFLGLTATPERMDGRDVLKHCDYNIAYEIRLLDAVDRGLLAPFQYFAVYDETDYSQIAWRGTGYDEDELDRALINDTRGAIIARNIQRYLPAQGKVKALAFCSSINHARFTARHLTNEGIEALSLVGMSSEEERQAAIDRLQLEEDPLRVICSVDIFNEGLDIPGLTHVLFLRPTQSFTIFLQQLGRGLRKIPGKEYLVAIDFVGNFRKAHVAPLALNGYVSIEGFKDDFFSVQKAISWQRLPKGCFLTADLEVERIWDDEIRKIVGDGLSAEDRLKALYLEIKTDLEGESPSLMDFYASAYDVDPYVFIKQFGSWMRAKEYCEGKLPSTEENLIGTPAEGFLQHLEKELSPVKSYKMVVLRSLLDLPGNVWKIEDIARKFLDYFLSNRDRISDYEDLSRVSAPESFPIARVISKLKQMPLHFLSNTEKDYFALDLEKERFSLKPEIHQYWENEDFRVLAKDRVEFALARYFRRKSLRQTVYFQSDELTEGFTLEPKLVRIVLEKSQATSGGIRNVTLKLGKEKFQADLGRPDKGKGFFVAYRQDSGVVDKLSQLFPRLPQKGQKIFSVGAEKGVITIEIVDGKADLRGIVVQIPYSARTDSGYTAVIRKKIITAPENTSWEVSFNGSGYTGKMDVEIRDGESFMAWTTSKYKDKTRFPARIKAAATALFVEGLRGEFHVSAQGTKLEIRRGAGKTQKGRNYGDHQEIGTG